MLEGLLRMEKGDQILPFVRCFYGTPSTYLWDDEMGVTQHIHQGEGGEQGDPLMPMLFALGKHPALAAAQERLRGNELLFAYLDDVYAVCRPDRVGAIFAILEQELQAHAEIRLHLGKTQVWNRGGVTPDGVDELQRRARRLKPEAVVWKGDPQLPEEQQGVRVLGVPIGRGELVRVFLEKKNKEHETLFQRIPWLNDPQSAWLLLLMCASTRANFWLRSVHPDLTEAFALQHANVWTCLDTILGSPSVPGMAKVLASLSFSVGGLGLSSAHRNRESAHWASWADCLRTGHDRHPDIAETMIAQLPSVVSRVSRTVANWLRMRALRFLLGGNWQKHQQRGWRTPNPVSLNMGGNRRRRGWWNRASFTL